jgi:hypothetical protein
MMSLQFAAYYPPGCPPDDAARVTSDVLRCVEHDPPQSDDFVPVYCLSRSLFLGDNICQACGISVTSSIAHLKKAIALIPALRKYKYIAKGTVTPDSGVMKETPSRMNSAHCTWWPYLDVIPHMLFRVVEVIGDGRGN